MGEGGEGSWRGKKEREKKRSGGMEGRKESLAVVLKLACIVVCKCSSSHKINREPSRIKRS